MSFTCNRKPNAISKSDVIKEQVFGYIADKTIYLNKLCLFVPLFCRLNQHAISDTPLKVIGKDVPIYLKVKPSVLNRFFFPISYKLYNLIMLEKPYKAQKNLKNGFFHL